MEFIHQLQYKDEVHENIVLAGICFGHKVLPSRILIHQHNVLMYLIFIL